MAPKKSGLRFKPGYGPAAMTAKLSGYQAILNRELESAMQDAVLRVEAAAKEDVRVDTGNLRASITSEVEKENEELAGIIGTNVEYGPNIEILDPYLMPAIEENLDWIMKRFEKAMDNAERLS